MLRYLSAGESHGPGLVVTVEGLPASLEVTARQIQAELARRRLGFGRGPRMRFEGPPHPDRGLAPRTDPRVTARHIANTEWPKWEQEMSPAPRRTDKQLTQPRSGHADLPGMQSSATPTTSTGTPRAILCHACVTLSRARRG
ncbi:MAG: chorismate synthase [Acidimicrobiales bacterium]